MNNWTWFPILIEYAETGELVIIKAPEEIASGKPFKVVETRVGL